MKYGNLIIEKKEYVVLKRVLNLSGYHQDTALLKSVAKLTSEMETALVYDEADMPKDVVRLHSKVTIASINGWRNKFTLVLPKESDITKEMISLLTPMAAAVMGYAQWDVLEWEFPSGNQKLTIEAVERQDKYTHLNIVL